MNTAGVFKSDKGVIKPKRATKGSAWYDFYAPETITIDPHSMVQFNSKVRVYFRDRFVLHIYVIPSLERKGLAIANSVEIIDSNYTDNIHASIINISGKAITIKKGDRYIHGIFVPLLTDDED